MNIYDLCCLVLPGTDIKVVINIIDSDCSERYKVVSLDRFRLIEDLDPFIWSSPVDFVTSSGWNIQIHIHFEKDVYNKFVDNF